MFFYKNITDLSTVVDNFVDKFVRKDETMNVDKDELLSKLKELLKGEVSTISYDTWFAPLGIDSIKDEHIVFTVNSEFQQDFIENKFNNLIFNTLRYITNKEWTFSVIDLSKNQNDNQTIIADKKSNVSDTELENNHQTLNPKYTFETFVVGNNNRFAHAAALAVGNEPGKSYNPLFLYGGVGLGKTHLMQAIGNRILENNPKSNVLYVTSEKFTNQLINAIKDSKTEMFRNKYRNIDVLLIDDIQFNRQTQSDKCNIDPRCILCQPQKQDHKPHQLQDNQESDNYHSAGQHADQFFQLSPHNITLLSGIASGNTAQALCGVAFKITGFCRDALSFFLRTSPHLHGS